MSKISLGSRIPEDVINDLRKYCKSKGIVINHFVTEAIKEKLNKIREDEEDIQIVEIRRNDSSIGEDEWNEYLKNRGMSV
jgi:CTP synthase (UTP-ammonia lyase)